MIEKTKFKVRLYTVNGMIFKELFCNTFDDACKVYTSVIMIGGKAPTILKLVDDDYIVILDN